MQLLATGGLQRIGIKKRINKVQGSINCANLAVGMSLSLIVGLLLIGFILILVEIFLIPGFVVGVVGIAFIAVGLGFVYNDYGTFYGNITLVSSIVVLSGSILAAFRSGAWDKVAIKDEIKGKANSNHLLKIEVGDRGEAISALRPAGTALIGGQKIEVHSEGEFLLRKDKIEVIKKIGNRIIVKKIE